MGFGYLNALMRQLWNPSSKKQIFAGLFSTPMAFCLENRIHDARFMRPVIRRLVQPCLRATATPAGRFGAQRAAIPEIPPIVNFIGMPGLTSRRKVQD